jgi:SlyX protein
MSVQALQELEIKLAFLERANTELSDVVYGQQRALDALQERVRLLEAQVDVLRESLLRGSG